MMMTIGQQPAHARRHGGGCAKMAAGLLALGLLAGWDAGAPAEAKTPGSTYCFLSVCHRVKSLQEIQDLVGKREQLRTSFYDSCSRDRFNPCGLTSSGEAFRPGEADNAASPIYPDGTTLLLWHPQTQEAAVVRVNNAGPYWGERKLDVSRATAEKLGFKGSGTAKLDVEVVKAPAPGEASYRRNRKYEPVLGHIGRYESVEEARAGMTVVMALQAIASSVLAPITGGALFEDDGAPAESNSAIAAADQPAASKAATRTRAATRSSGRAKVAGASARTRTAAAASRGKTRLASHARSKVARSGKTRVAAGRSRAKARAVAELGARARTVALPPRPAPRRAVLASGS
jgi:rare lipoprotein A